MLKLLKKIGIKPQPDPVLDMVSVVLGWNHPATLRVLGGDAYTIGEANHHVTVDMLDDEAYFEITINFAYRRNNGFKLVLSNYGPHRIEMTHGVSKDSFFVMHFEVPTESYHFDRYRAVFDDYAEGIMAEIEDIYTPREAVA